MMPALGQLTWWLLWTIARIVSRMSSLKSFGRGTGVGLRSHPLHLAARWADGLAECLPALGLPRLCRQEVCRLDGVGLWRERDLDGDAVGPDARGSSRAEFYHERGMNIPGRARDR